MSGMPTAPQDDAAQSMADSSRQVALSTLLLASVLAWADGVVQPAERNQLTSMAHAEHAQDPAFPLAQALGWLEVPPTDAELQWALSILRQVEQPAAHLAHAETVAAAHGGLLGVAAIGHEESETLRWLHGLLAPGTQPPSAPASAFLERLNTLRSVLVERSLAPALSRWSPPAARGPQPCPRYPDRMPPAVNAVSPQEYQAYCGTVVRRYASALTGHTWRALGIALRPPPPLDDATMSDLLWLSPFSRFLTPSLDPHDHHVFAEVLRDLPTGTRVYKVDHTHLPRSRCLPGIYVGATLGLLAATPDGVRPLAIVVDDHLCTPGDGENWERARLFLLQSCGLALVGGAHATLHFPGDTFIAVTRQHLHAFHPVARLVEAHSYLHLALDYGVRWSPKSYAHNNQHEIYTAFPVAREDIFESFGTYYTGVEGNSAYPAYRHPMTPPAIPGPYGHALRVYYDAVLAFCRVVAEHAAAEPLIPWAHALQGVLPGFPSPEELHDPEVLARALAGFVHGCSIWHALEHHLYGQIPVQHNPHRLRVEPPSEHAHPTPWWRRTRQSDTFRQEMARHMFYEAHPVQHLLDVAYGFEEPSLHRASERFIQRLRRIDESLPARYRGLDHIATSIQF